MNEKEQIKKLKNIRGIVNGTISTKVNIIKALHSFNSEVGHVLKNASNPFFKSKYADLNAFLEVVKEPLHNNGLIIIQSPITNGLDTTIYHTSGESISSKMEIEFPKDPQKIGSVITYFRRYMLQSMLFLNAEDDDGNKASGKNYDGKAINEETKKHELIFEFKKEYNTVKTPNQSLINLRDDIDNKTVKQIEVALQKIKLMEKK